MRILHVIPSMASRTGGPSVAVAAIAQAIRMSGDSAVIFCTDIGSPPQGETVHRVEDLGDLVSVVPGVQLRCLPTVGPIRLGYSPQLRAALRAEMSGFDLVHIHTLFLYPQYAAFTEARRQNIPYIVSPHGALDPVLRGRGRLRKGVTSIVWQNRMFANAACVHVTSQQEAAWCREFGYRGEIRIVPIPVVLDPYIQVRPIRDDQTSTNALRIVSHGRLSMKKGLSILVSALDLVRREVPEARLTLIGPDDEGIGEQLRTQAAALKLEDKIHYTGPLAPNEIAHHLETATVWALPSLGENFGVAVVEAMAASVPVITTPEVNIAPAAAAAGALIMVDRSPEHFAAAILDLYHDQELAVRLGDAGVRYAQRFTVENLAAEYGNLYREFSR